MTFFFNLRWIHESSSSDSYYCLLNESSKNWSELLWKFNILMRTLYISSTSNKNQVPALMKHQIGVQRIYGLVWYFAYRRINK